MLLVTSSHSAVDIARGMWWLKSSSCGQRGLFGGYTGSGRTKAAYFIARSRNAPNLDMLFDRISWDCVTAVCDVINCDLNAKDNSITNMEPLMSCANKENESMADLVGGEIDTLRQLLIDAEHMLRVLPEGEELYKHCYDARFLLYYRKAAVSMLEWFELRKVLTIETLSAMKHIFSMISAVICDELLKSERAPMR